MCLIILSQLNHIVSKGIEVGTFGILFFRNINWLSIKLSVVALISVVHKDKRLLLKISNNPDNPSLQSFAFNIIYITLYSLVLLF